MSFQLIHTSYPHLLDSSASGYGTVARSENLPAYLLNKLTSISVLKDPRGGSCSVGPQYSYRILELSGKAWHVLSCVQPAGADYSGRACHTAHHLILSQQEVTQMLKEESRPTPAGLCHALADMEFWVRKWQGEPRYLVGEPLFKPEKLPNATVQPTWKKLTGHKSNARAFFTHPYDREVLVTVPPGTAANDVLDLFHESDWLTQTRGWGVTFSTEVDEADSFAETLRMVCVPSSPLVQRAIRTGHPVLHISQEMELSVLPAVQAPVSSPVQPSPPTEQSPLTSAPRILSRAVSTYHYTEEPDWMLYDVPIPELRRNLINYAALSVGSMGILAAGIWLWQGGAPSSTPDAAWLKAPEQFDASQEPFLRNRLEQQILLPYQHEQAQELLEAMASISETGPQDALLLEIAVLIQQAQQHRTNRPQTLHRLCECARMLGLDARALARFYMHAATHGVDAEEWHAQFDASKTEDWLKLWVNEPHLNGLFDTSKLKPYEPGSYDAPEESTELAPAIVPVSEPVPGIDENASAPALISGVFSPVVTDGRIPIILAKALTELPLSISAGEYILASFSKGESLAASQSLQLSPDGFRLYITPTEEDGVYELKPEHINNKPSPLPPARFKILNGRLRYIKSQNREAVVSFPVPQNDEYYAPVIMVSSFEIPVPESKPLAFPQSDSIDFTISDDDLQILSPSEQNPAYSLRLKRNKKGRKFPWTLDDKHVETRTLSLNLPVLNGHNNLEQGHHKNSIYRWKGAVVTERGKLTTAHCVIQRHPDFPDRLLRAFDIAANHPCCGNADINPQFNIAHMYDVLKRLSNASLKPKERKKVFEEYVHLFTSKKFAAELRNIFKGYESFLLTQEEASSNKHKGKSVRATIERELTPEICQQLSMVIRTMLRNTLKQVYEKEIQDFKADGNRKSLFKLKKLSQGEHGELLWHLNLGTKK